MDSRQTVDNLDEWWTNPEHSDFDQTGKYSVIKAGDLGSFKQSLWSFIVNNIL